MRPEPCFAIFIRANGTRECCRFSAFRELFFPRSEAVVKYTVISNAWEPIVRFRELRAVKNTAEIPYKLNTIIGKTADLAALVARDEDRKTDEYLQGELEEYGPNIDGHIKYEGKVITGLKDGDTATDIAIGTFDANNEKIAAEAFKDEVQLKWVHINPGVSEIA